MSNEIWAKANELKDYFTDIRRQIHQHPELGGKETHTADLIRRELSSCGIEIVPFAVPTGVVGLLYGKKAGPDQVTALRADIDALPIVEKTGLPYSSQQTGIMHACGHDGHTAMLLGAAKLLSTMTDQFSGTVKFVFQPGEETLSGAKDMVTAGVLENPPVDSMAAVHSWPHLPVGVLGTWKGPYYASADAFSVKIIGGSGHGAYPHKSNDSLLTAAQIVVALQNITSRQLNAIDNTVLSVCTFHGGTAFNIIPEFVEFGGTVRCHNSDIRRSMPDKMEKIIKNMAEAFGCKYEFTYNFAVPVVKNDHEIVDLLAAAAAQTAGEGFVTELPGPVMGSEDFGMYSEKIERSAILRLGVGNDQNAHIPLHNERFDFNDDAIPYGIALFTQYVLNKNS